MPNTCTVYRHQIIVTCVTRHAHAAHVAREIRDRLDGYLIHIDVASAGNEPVERVIPVEPDDIDTHDAWMRTHIEPFAEGR